MKKIFFILSFLFIFPLNIHAAITNTTGGLGATTNTGLPPGYVSQNENPSMMTVPIDQMTTGGIPQSFAPTNYFDSLNQQEQNKNVSSESFLSQIVPLDKIGLTQGDQPLNKLFNQLFYVGLVAAVILAIVMIIRGGVEYMTIDAISSKENGKNRIKAALGGLLLAFSAILILNTINPGLTSLRIIFSPLSNVNSVAIETDLASALGKSSPLTEAQIQEFLASGKIPSNISPAAQKILAQTLSEINKMNTGELDNTQGGYLACAAAVNRIIELATGQPAGGGVSTTLLQKALENNSKFELVPGGLQNSLPGDIVVSPTITPGAGKHGHAGIVTGAGGGSIVSNSSTAKTIQNNYTAEKWTNRYVNQRGLGVYVYRPK